MTEDVERIIATDRAETECCEALTPGCCIDHGAESREGRDRDSCETW